MHEKAVSFSTTLAFLSKTVSAPASQSTILLHTNLHHSKNPYNPHYYACSICPSPPLPSPSQRTMAKKKSTLIKISLAQSLVLQQIQGASIVPIRNALSVFAVVTSSENFIHWQLHFITLSMVSIYFFF